MNTSKNTLLRWCGWFLLGNALLFWMIALLYLPTIFPGENFALTIYGKILTGLFVFFTYCSYLTLLAFLPLLLLLPGILLYPRRRFIFTLAVGLSTLAAFLLFADAMAYRLYQFHLNGVILDLVINGLRTHMFAFSTQEYVLGVSVAAGIFSVESFFAVKLWQVLVKLPRKRGLKFSLFWAMCLYFSYAMITFSVDYPINKIFIDEVRFLPFYYNFLMPTKYGLIGLERHSERRFMHPEQVNLPLNYPLQANLQCTPAKQPLNLVIIVIDTWRFDMLQAEVAPNLYQFSKRSWVFDQHFSGGNATGPGIFSLFYGLPATYWTAMKAQHRGPVLISELLRQHYQMGIFASASLRLPTFDETVFTDLKDIRTLPATGKNAYERDVTITQEFKNFVAAASQKPQPFFSFLFYDTLHSYCDVDNNLKPFQPVIKQCQRFSLSSSSDLVPYINRYKNALLLVDEQVRQVLEVLGQKHLLENTVVMVTGDHGEEFNDNKLGYWGHASNFTHYQVQTPLIVYWPGKKPRVYSHQTSHYDIAPTVLQDLLNCKANASNYSVGLALRDTKLRAYLVVGSYIDFGITEPTRITTVFPLGNFEVDRINGQPIPGGELKLDTFRAALRDLKRFYVM